MVLLCRPLASVLLLKRGKLLPMLLSIVISSCALLAYPTFRESMSSASSAVAHHPGHCLAAYSSCTVAAGQLHPHGQSARGFACSPTMLLPYSDHSGPVRAYPAVLGGEPHLFAFTAVLGLPALARFPGPAPAGRWKMPPRGRSLSVRALWQAVSHSGLFFIYMACLTFSIMTVLAIFFMKGLCSVTGAQPAWFSPHGDHHPSGCSAATA